jgi:hypothetical protein
VPAILESLTGVNIQDLLSHVPGTKDAVATKDTVQPARRPTTESRVDAEPVNGQEQESPGESEAPSRRVPAPAGDD